MIHTRARALRMIRMTAVLAAASVVLAGALAQDRKVPVPVTGPPQPVWPKELAGVIGKHRIPAGAAIKGGVLGPAEEAALRALYGAYIQGFSEKEVIPGLWRVRQDMRLDLAYAGNAPSPAVHNFLRQHLFDELKKLVADEKQHIFTRTNALGMIGDLNQKEASPGPPLSPMTPPTPLAAATPYMLQVFEDAKAPAALKVTALRGLNRHAQLGIANAQDAAAVQAALAKAAQDAKVPADCSPEGHEWIRRRAVEILGYVKNPASATLLVTIAADPQASLAFRCEAARSLGMLTLNTGNAVATAATAEQLGELAATIAETQTDRRVLHELLDCVRIGLGGTNPKTPGGLRAATPAADAKLATALYAHIDPFVKLIDPENRPFKDEQLPEETTEFVRKLREEILPPPKSRTKTIRPFETPKAGESKKPEPPKTEAKTEEPSKKGAKTQEPAKTKDAKAG